MIVTMLPNNEIVQNVYKGKDGVLETVQSGSFLIDSSTVDPAVSKHVSVAATGTACVNCCIMFGINVI